MSDDGQRVAFISDGPFPGLNRDKEEQAFHTQLPNGAMTPFSQGPSGQFGISGVAIRAMLRDASEPRALTP